MQIEGPGVLVKVLTITTMTVDQGRAVGRVLYVGAWMDVGGAEKFALDALDQLRHHGIATAIVTTVESEHRWRSSFERRVDATLDLTTVASTRRAGALVRFARQFDPDVILVSNSAYLYDLMAYVRRRLPGVAIVDYCHAEQPEWRRGGYPAMSIRQRRWLSRTLCASAHLREWMIDRGADAERCDVVRCNVDADYWHRGAVDPERARACVGASPDSSVVAVVARMDENKRPIVAFDAIARAAGAVPITALFVGSGPLEESLRTHAAATDRVRLEIRAGGPDLVRIAYAAADVVVLPSSAEGISLAVYEAMSMGVPVIASDVGGHGELVTAATGVLIGLSGDVDTDTERFARALQALLASNDVRAALGASARQRVVESFSLPAMGDRLVDSLRRAFPGPGVGPVASTRSWVRALLSLKVQTARRSAANVVQRSQPKSLPKARRG